MASFSWLRLGDFFSLLTLFETRPIFLFYSAIYLVLVLEKLIGIYLFLVSSFFASISSPYSLFSKTFL